jgi:solute carrier family 35 protein C2
MNSLDGGSRLKKSRRPRRMTRRDTDGIQEEGKPVDDDSRDSADDSRSTSEDVELDRLSDDEDQDDEETGLTSKDKRKRRTRKRRNTLLDQRVAGEVKITDEERRKADQNVFKKSVINGALIGLW